MRVNQLKAGAIISYLQMAFGVVIGLLYTPVMIRLLGPSEYGLYNTVSSTISMLSVLSLGFNSSYIRYYSRYKLKKDEESISNLNGLFLVIFCIIGSIAMLCGMFLSFNLELVFDEGLTVDEYEIAKVLMILLTANLAISFPMGVFQNIISAHERYVFLKLLAILKTVVSPLVTLPLLLMGFRSIAMVTVTLAISIFVDIIYLVYAKKVLKVKIKFGRLGDGVFKSLFIFTFFIALNLIVDQINSNVDKFLLGRFKGTEVVAVYSVGFSLYQYYSMFSTAISGVFTPRIHRIVNETKGKLDEQKRLITNLFIKVGRIQFMVLSLISSGLVFFGKPFISFWAGEGYEEAYYVALLLVLPASIALIQNIGIEVQRALNKHQFRSAVYTGMAIVNLVVTIFMCQLYGAIGAAVGTAVSLILANGILMNIYYHKKCNINILAFWKSILKCSLGIIVPIIFGVVINELWKITSIFQMFIAIGAYSVIYCLSMWFIGMEQYEKNLILNPIRKILKK